MGLPTLLRRRIHPIILLDYWPRMLGQLVSVIMISSAIYNNHPPIYIWILLSLEAFVWAHFCLLMSLRSKNPKPLELFFLAIDAFLLGCWTGYVHFQPVIGASILASITMGNMSTNGFKQYFISIATFLVGALLVGYIDGFYIDIYSTFPTTMISTVSLFFFTAMIGYLVHQGNVSIKRSKKQLLEVNHEILNINQIIEASITTLDINRMMTQMIPVIKEIFNFDVASIQLADYENDHLNFYAGYGELVTASYAESLRKIDVKISAGQAVSVRVLKTGKSFYRDNISPTTTMLEKDRQLFDIRPFLSVLVIPIIIQGEALGVISFYSHYTQFSLSLDNITRVKRYVSQLAMVIKNAALFLKLKEKQNLLHDKNEQLADLSKRLSHYLSPQIYDEIFAGKKEVKVSSTRKRLTVFFSDIAGFTDMTDRIEAEFLTQLINEYLTEMSHIAIKYGGTIDKYIGDAIMIFFGDPATKGVKQDALNCVLMAIEMQMKLQELAEKWHREGIAEAISVRIGITSGFCAVGNFGSIYRLEYTIMGGQVNLASRLQSLAKAGEIIIAESTYLLVKDEIKCEQRGEVKVKGIAHPLQIYVVLANNLPQPNIIDPTTTQPNTINPEATNS